MYQHHPAYVPAVPAVPLQPYRPRQYVDDEEEENRAPLVVVQPSYEVPTRLPLDELLLPLAPVPRPTFADGTISALPPADKPLPFSYLPDSSPIKRAWMAATGQVSVRKVRPPPPPPPEEPKDGGLFAEFLQSMAEEEDHAANGTAINRSPTRAARLPTASPLGEIISEIRRKKSAREALAASQPKAIITNALATPVRARTRSRSRSRSRSRERMRARARSIERSPPAAGAEIDVELLHQYLRPLGLNITSLHQLSAASIQSLAAAVATNSVEPALPKPRVASRGRPRSAAASKAAEQEALRLQRHGHFVAHEKLTTAEEDKFAVQHPSIIALRKTRSFEPVASAASGGEGLPLDPAAVRATQEANQRAADARARANANSLRPEEATIEEEAVVVAAPPPRNQPLERIVPPVLVEKLLYKLGGPPPRIAPSATARTHSSQVTRDRAQAAAESKRAENFSSQIAPRLQQRTNAQKQKAYDEIVRAENRERLLASKARAQAKTNQEQPDGAKPPTVLTPTQLAYHLQTGTVPTEPYSLAGLFCRVVVRAADQWREIEQAIQQQQAASVTSAAAVLSVTPSPSTAPLPSSTQLSVSRFSFVTASDFLSYLLHSPGQERDWLRALGFEAGWVEQQVTNGALFKLVIFRATEVEDAANENAAAVVDSIRAYRAKGSNIFTAILPKLLAADPAASRTSNAVRNLVLARLQSMHEEIIQTPWAEVTEIALEQGLDHVYEDRPFLTFEAAAESIGVNTFDVVQARRFLYDHLHLTCLFSGDGFTMPESHSQHEIDAAQLLASARSPTFREFLVETRAIEAIPGGVSVVELLHPLGRTRRQKAPSAEELAARREWEMAAQYTMSGQAPPDPAAQVLAAHLQSRTRSRSRPRTSMIDTGLKCKPGTEEYRKLAEQRELKQLAATTKEREAEKAAIEAKHALVAKQAAERKLLRLKKKQASADALAPSPVTIASFALPILPTLDVLPPALEAKYDDYATDEFADAAPAAIPTAAPSSSEMTAAMAAAGLTTADGAKAKIPSKKKNKRASSKKKGSKTEEAPKIVHAPLKPQLPSFQFPAPALAPSPVIAVDSTGIQPDSSDPPIAAAAPIPAPANPTSELEALRIRKKALLKTQLQERKEHQRTQAQRKAAEERRRKESLRALHAKCNAIARPQSAVPPTGVSSSQRSHSATRGRAPSSSPIRRRRTTVADDETLDSESFVDGEVARALAQHDLVEFELAKRKEIDKLEQKMNQLAQTAAAISEASETNARKLKREHERNLKEINSLQRRVAVNDKPRSQRAESIAAAASGVPSRVSRSPSSSVDEVATRDTQAPVPPVLSAPVPDPRLEAVYSLAQHLSTRFSSLLGKIGDKTIDPAAKRQLVLDGALVHGAQTALDQFGGAPSAFAHFFPAAPTITEAPMVLGHAERTPQEEISRALTPPHPEDQARTSDSQPAPQPPSIESAPSMSAAEVSALVRSEIVPPVHLEAPYARVASESSRVELPTPALASVLLPAALSQMPFPTGFCHQGSLPHENISPHTLLFAETSMPSASAFLSTLPSSTTAPSFSVRPRPPSSRPYYDLATQEYEALQLRIQREKERFQFV